MTSQQRIGLSGDGIEPETFPSEEPRTRNSGEGLALVLAGDEGNIAASIPDSSMRTSE